MEKESEYLITETRRVDELLGKYDYHLALMCAAISVYFYERLTFNFFASDGNSLELGAFLCLIGATYCSLRRIRDCAEMRRLQCDKTVITGKPDEQSVGFFGRIPYHDRKEYGLTAFAWIAQFMLPPRRELLYREVKTLTKAIIGATARSAGAHARLRDALLILGLVAAALNKVLST